MLHNIKKENAKRNNKTHCRIRALSLCTTVFCVLSFALLQAQAEETQPKNSWPQFRGPGGQGLASEGKPPTEWSQTKNIAWRVAIPGKGWSSPVVDAKHIWLTTSTTKEADAETREKMKAKVKAPGMPLNFVEKITLYAICLDRKSGEILRRIKLFEIEQPQPIHSLNSYASPTPVLNAGRLYCYFGTYGTACLDTETGNVLWRKDFPLEHYVGPGSSPVLCGNALILTCDGADKQYIVAVDATSGDVLWKTNRPAIRASNPDLQKSFCTPLVIDVEGKEQVVIPGAQWLVAYDPENGKELWKFDHGTGFSIVPRPVYNGKQLLFCTGFPRPQLIAVNPVTKSDITRDGILWKYSKQVPSMPSPLLVNSRVYTISDGGVATCLDATTGKMLWRKRIPGKYAASLQKLGNHIAAFSREGVTTIFEDADRYKEVSKNQLPSSIMATPAVLGDAIFLRTATHLYRIEEK